MVYPYNVFLKECVTAWEKIHNRFLSENRKNAIILFFLIF